MHPKRVPDFVNTLIRMSEQSPDGLAVWPLQGFDTLCMTGYHSVSVIAEALVKGFKGISSTRAYAPMRKRAFTDDYQGLNAYRAKGYVPADQERESASKTLEYCYNDWAIAHVAKLAGQDQDAKVLKSRSFNYRNLFDSTMQFIRAKNANGDWTGPFNPFAIGHKKNYRDYTESNSWQTTFGIMHDPAGLIKAFGGDEAFVAKLDQLFVAQAPAGISLPPDVAGLIGQYAHGNEPSHHIAYLYLYAGQPHKAQKRLRMILDSMYSAKPGGLAGNEDCGQMSAWYVMSAMGLYAVDPVSGRYVIGSPLFDRVEIELENRRSFVIETARTKSSDVYVSGVSLNGVAFQRLWLTHEEIRAGGRLVVQMSAEPEAQFGADIRQRPLSASQI